MKYALNFVVLADLVFVVFLSVSGSVPGILGEVIYYLGFLLPVAVALFGRGAICRRENAESPWKQIRQSLKVDKDGGVLTLAVAAPAVTLIFLVSFLTSLVLTELGIEGSAVADAPIWVMLTEHALLPAILEETLFRLVPMILLAGYSKRATVLWSSLFFALVHCNLFQIPYALVAGVIFMTVDLAAGSVLPSVFLHLFNNTLSVIWLKYCKSEGAVTVYVATLLVLSVVSLVFIILERKKFEEKIRGVFSHGRTAERNASPLALIIPTLFVAIVNAVFG